MEENIVIRNEKKEDWETVEKITRQAFYNLYVPGCVEHELRPHALDGHKWVYQDSPVMAISEEEAERYDAALEPMEKKHLPSQEEFYIMSRSFVEG